jgi:hypothetical protein
LEHRRTEASTPLAPHHLLKELFWPDDRFS